MGTERTEEEVRWSEVRLELGNGAGRARVMSFWGTINYLSSKKTIICPSAGKTGTYCLTLKRL